MTCDFVIQLNRLRKLSAESVENTDHFDPFKEYMHVVRPVEIELRELLRNANAKQKKCLILLCGSAGDGKSHLISYLKNSDSEGLLTDYEPYNDATESSEPTLTSIDTLSEKLFSFNDDNYLLNDGKKMIVAINLGTLNNFIESDKGKKFSKLKEYVENNGIFSGYGHGSAYIEDSVFQHVSFSDYQVFSLGESGVETTFLENLLEKIFKKSLVNPFYKAYLDDESCSMCQRCPVRHNFEFLSDLTNQKALIRRIVEVVIKDKTIVSTREVLNLLFDTIVHPDFDKKRISVGTSDIKYLTDYINWTTPMLLDEFEDISSFLNSIRKHDVLKTRTNSSDDAATRFHSMDNIHDVFEKATQGTPYQILNNLTDISILGGIKIELKKIIYRFIVRLNAFRNESTAPNQHRLEEFIRYLYYQNSGNEKKLAELYTATKKAVLYWDGQFEDDCICIDDSNDQLWIVEQLQLKSAINKHAIPTTTSIQRFSPTLRLRFKRESLSAPETAEIGIDYALYELITDMKEGYRPTVQDKNIHADFVSFVQKVIEFGNKESRIILIPKESGKDYKMIFEETDFGFEFKVV